MDILNLQEMLTKASIPFECREGEDGDKEVVIHFNTDDFDNDIPETEVVFQFGTDYGCLVDAYVVNYDEADEADVEKVS